MLCNGLPGPRGERPVPSCLPHMGHYAAQTRYKGALSPEFTLSLEFTLSGVEGKGRGARGAP